MNVFIQIAVAFGVASIAVSHGGLKYTGIVLGIVSAVNAFIGMMQLTWSL